MAEQIKTCMNCAMRRGGMRMGKCLATGNYPDLELQYGDRCAPDWKLWKPRPSMTRRFIEWLLRW